MAEDVVGRHGVAVPADYVIAPGIQGRAQFGAHAVGAGNQNGIPVFFESFEGVEAGEGAQAAEDFGALGGPGGVFHLLYGADSFVFVHSGVAIAEGGFGVLH